MKIDTVVLLLCLSVTQAQGVKAENEGKYRLFFPHQYNAALLGYHIQHFFISIFYFLDDNGINITAFTFCKINII